MGREDWMHEVRHHIPEQAVMERYASILARREKTPLSVEDARELATLFTSMPSEDMLSPEYVMKIMEAVIKMAIKYGPYILDLFEKVKKHKERPQEHLKKEKENASSTEATKVDEDDSKKERIVSKDDESLTKIKKSPLDDFVMRMPAADNPGLKGLSERLKRHPEHKITESDFDIKKNPDSKGEEVKLLNATKRGVIRKADKTPDKPYYGKLPGGIDDLIARLDQESRARTANARPGKTKK